MLEELKTMLTDMGKNFESIKKLADGHEQMLEGLDAETLKKAVSGLGAHMEEYQETKQKLEAQQNELKRVEALFSRVGGGKDAQDSEEELKARKEVARYLKKGVAMDTESASHVIESLLDGKFKHMGDDDRALHLKALVGSIGPQGGYFIRPEVSSRMITRIFETSAMRNYATVENITSDILEIVIDDNELIAGGWVGETQSRSETGTPDIGVKQIPVHEQYAQPAATQRMLDDAGFDIEGWLGRKTTNKMIRDENLAFVTGDGNGKPRGFLTYPAWNTAGVYQRGAIEQIESAASKTVAGDDFKKVQNAMIEDYNAGAAWFMKRASFEAVITLKDLNDNYLLNFESMRLGDEKLLLGKPVSFFNDMPQHNQTVTGDVLSYAYANFSTGYTVVDRLGFRVIRDEVTKKPFVLFYTVKRTGGDVTNYEAIKLLKVKA